MSVDLRPFEVIPKFTMFNEGVQLFYLNDGRFQVTKNDKFCSFIWAAPSYFLFRYRLARLLIEKLIPKVMVKSAYIFRISTGEWWNNYFDIRIGDQISNIDSSKIISEGLNVWHYKNRHLFVSPNLKALIQDNGFHDLSFSRDFYYQDRRCSIGY